MEIKKPMAIHMDVLEQCLAIDFWVMHIAYLQWFEAANA